jgi:hypothetical protein
LNYRKQLNYVAEPLTTQFPDIVPQYIDNFRLTSYANNIVKFADAEQTVLFNNIGQGAELTLKYTLINAEKLKILSSFYKQQANKVNYFQLPDSIWRHPTLFKQAINPSDYCWVFPENLAFNVRVADTEKGLWNLDIKLKQVLRSELNPNDEELNFLDLVEIQNNLNKEYTDDPLEGCDQTFTVQVKVKYSLQGYPISTHWIEANWQYLVTGKFFSIEVDSAISGVTGIYLSPGFITTVKNCANQTVVSGSNYSIGASGDSGNIPLGVQVFGNSLQLKSFKAV